MPENQPQPYKKPEFMGVGWGSDLMRKWKSLGQPVGIQNIALARLLNKLSEDMGFSPPPSDKIKTRGGPGAVVEAVSGPVANLGSIIRILRKFSPQFAKSVQKPIVHSTALKNINKIIKEGIQGKGVSMQGTNPIRPDTGLAPGAISLTRSMEGNIPHGLPHKRDVQLIFDEGDIRAIGKLKPYDYYGDVKPALPSTAEGKYAKEMEEVFRQTENVGGHKLYKQTPIIPSEIIRGIIVRKGIEPARGMFQKMPVPAVESVADALQGIGATNVPTILSPKATGQLIRQVPPQQISRSMTGNIIPTYKEGQPRSSEFLMKLVQWLGQQAR